MVKLRVEKEDRAYTGGYPHVTELTALAQEKFIWNWRKAKGLEAEKIMNEARDIGTAVHTVFEAVGKLHGTGEAVEVPDLYRPYLEGAYRFFGDYIEEVIATEQALVSHRHGFGGKTDLIARLTPKHGGGVAIIDFKTTKNGLKREDGLQFAAYKLLAEENGYEIDRRLGVWVKKKPGHEGKWRVRDYPDHAIDAAGFLHMVGFYYYMENALPPEEPFID